MTVSTTDNRVSYAGNGVTTAFSFPNVFFANSDLVVLLVNDTTGASTTQVLDTDYTVTGAENPAGGTVTMLTAPATGTTLVIYRDPPLTQTTDLVNGDAFDSETLEETFDKLTLMVQRLKDVTDRKIGIPESDATGTGTELPPAVSRANKYLAFDSAGDAVVVSGTADTGLLRDQLANQSDVSLGDALVGGKRTDTGAEAFTLHQYHENRLPNIKTDFGASGGGVSDDYAEIQAAINSVTNGEVGIFIVPAGTYLINSALSGGTRKLLWILEGDVTLSGTSPTLPGDTITYGTKQQTVVGQNTFDPFVDQHIEIVPQTSQHHFGLVVGMDATGQTDGKDKCPAYFASKGNGAVDLWGANTLVRLESGFSGGANSIEADVNNNSGSDGKGVGILVNGASNNKILAGIILRMNGGVAGGQVGLRIEDDWDDQLMLQGAVTNSTLNQADGGAGNDALLSFDQDPATASNNAQIRFFRSTAAASCKVTFHNNAATEQVAIDASNGRVTAVGKITALSSTAIPAGGTAGSGFLFSSTANFGIFFGSGAPTLSAARGSIYLRSDGSATSGLTYINTDGGTTWAAITNNTVSADKGDAAATLTAGTSEQTNQWNTPITADRAVTLSTTGAVNGNKFRIVRTAAATGAFNLNVGTGPLKALTAGQWCDVEYNGSAWMLTAFGSL